MLFIFITSWRGRSRLVNLETWHVTNKDSLPGGEEEGGVGYWAREHSTSQMTTHLLEGRKREEWVGELGDVAQHKQGLTNWRGGRGRSRLLSLGTQHITNDDSLAGGEEDRGAGWWAWKHSMSQTMTHQLEGKEEKEWVCELGNDMWWCKNKVTCVWRGQVSSWVAKKQSTKKLHMTWMCHDVVWQHFQHHFTHVTVDSLFLFFVDCQNTLSLKYHVKYIDASILSMCVHYM